MNPVFAVGVHFLTGRYVASEHHDRERPEWPPHPARLFSAMVATWADSDRPDPDERSALEWLEGQGPPDIAASAAAPRSVVTHFVPVNDAAIVSRAWYERRAREVDAIEAELAELEASDPGAARLGGRRAKALDVSSQVGSGGRTPVASAVALLPEGRGRQARFFPSVVPDEPHVTFIWRVAPPGEVQVTLDRILGGVVRLGHSSSLVSCRTVSDPPDPTLVPNGGDRPIRWVRAGQLDALERSHARHRGSDPRSLPSIVVGYGPAKVDDAVSSRLQPDTAGDWLVFELLSRKLPMIRAVEVAKALRAAVLHYATDPMPEGLSGHRSDGSPTAKPHVAYLPIPYVGFEYADGRLMGVAIGLPHSLESPARLALLRAIGAWESRGPDLTLTLGGHGTARMIRRQEPIELVTLRPALWGRQSHRWVSATPIALPTHPGGLRSGTPAARTKAWRRAEQAIVQACLHLGLPEPIEVVASLSPLLRGARPATDFPSFRQRGRDGQPVARQLVHAAINFDRPVDGPFALGSGRFLGLGLMRPAADMERTDA